MTQLIKAPELITQKWLGANAPLSLESLRGKVVMISAFQMLCPGCVEVGLPQAQKVHNAFSKDEIMVLGLHTVFEHHEAMREESLKAFLYEYRLSFPVGIDMPSESGAFPKTMEAYAMQGTPTTILIDHHGRLRKKQLGHTPDLLLGAELMSLIKEKDDNPLKINDGNDSSSDKKVCKI